MAWVAILTLALLAFAFAAFVLKLPRDGWTLFAALLVFGLAGYAWQGSTAQPGSPKAAQLQAPQSGEAMVDFRRSLFDDGQPKPGYLTVSDGFARRGQFSDAAGLLRQGLSDNPAHTEGWMALANALIEHTGGVVTPAARHAYERAYASDPDNPISLFILARSYERMGDLRNAREIWQDLLAGSPEDAPWREDLAGRIEAIDARMSGPVMPSPMQP